MKTIAVFGASGRTGKPFVNKALQAGYAVIALVRTPASFPITHPSLKIIQGDILKAAEVNKTIAGTDAVVSLIGHVNRSAADLQTTATRHIVAAMKKHGVKRLISLTGGGVPDPNDQPKLVDKLFVFVMKNLAGKATRETLDDAVQHAALIRSTNLDWTIVRGPRLTEKPAKGAYRVGYVGVGTGISLTREDLADFIVKQLDDTTYVRKVPLISN